jgi:cyanophycinase
VGRVAPRAAALVLVAVCLTFFTARAGEKVAGPKAPGGPAKGAVLLCSLNSPEFRSKFIELAGGKKARLVLVMPRTPAGADLADAGAKAAKAWGVEKVTVCSPQDRAGAEAQPMLDALRDATGVWFPGGKPQQYADLFVGSKAQPALAAVLERGGVLGGESAGAMIQCESVTPPGDVAQSFEGFGFVRGASVFPHYGVKFTEATVQKLVAEHPGMLGLAMRDGVGVVVRGGDAEVIGKADVTVVRRGADGAAKSTVYRPGDHFAFAG